jgi:hypothetical protein
MVINVQSLKMYGMCRWISREYDDLAKTIYYIYCLGVSSWMRKKRYREMIAFLSRDCQSF